MGGANRTGSKGRTLVLPFILAAGIVVGMLFNMAFKTNVMNIEGLLGGVLSSLLVYWMS